MLFALCCDISGLFGYGAFTGGAGYSYFPHSSGNAQRLLASGAGIVAMLSVLHAAVEPFEIVYHRVGQLNESAVFHIAAVNVFR